jgi:hypothetical protein
MDKKTIRANQTLVMQGQTLRTDAQEQTRKYVKIYINSALVFNSCF